MTVPEAHEDAPERVRFVVLFHTQDRGDHFDLMIDGGDGLTTWKMAEPPENALSRELQCRRIADHRRAYLDYEGPVSGDRGVVRQHDAGWCEVRRRGENDWRIRLEGRRVRGRFRLYRSDQSESAWRLRCEPAPNPSG